ncbi:hypothetical protein [Pseudolysinimonas sp.]|uniref:hypothetical protein n=1 Tax=Pseudolysinimonas sp. TaxID=2680009 RepID=UPI003F7F543E
MTDTASAPPLRRRPFADPRLLVGLLLVAASIAATAGIVAAVDRRVQVYAAAGPLEPGQRIAASDLVSRGVALDGSDSLYLGVGDVPRGGLVVTRAVAQGELVPAASVGRTSDVDATSLVLRVATRVSAAVKPGASIDVWSSAAPDPGATTGDDAPATAPPTVLVAGATVVRVLDEQQALAVDRDGSAVEVRLPRARVARVLAALAAGDQLAIVPAGLGLGWGS